MSSFSRTDIIKMLSLEGRDKEKLFRKAVKLRNKAVSDCVYLRGLIEFSNICRNDCLYCGIRKSNRSINRYEYLSDDIITCVDEIVANGINSIVLQSGERSDASFIRNLAEILETIKTKYPAMVITLSVGEQTRETYRIFRKAGAERYLLRIETSSREHYGKLHPGEMSFDNRVRCLHDLQDLQYQVGTGVMIGSPYQTMENLAEDILFFKRIDIDMCGMGPYIPSSGSPLAGLPYDKEKSIDLGLKMITVLRHVMPDINIAVTTALETLTQEGWELGLLAGGNVIMPQFSPPLTRKEYMLYDNKPLFRDENISLTDSIKKIAIKCGMRLAAGDPGNSVHFKKKHGVH
ncbi:MAG: [FeFe] hydrogenase H-cluster radical SAM maturase HydE [Spirochaetes bacterium]|nr:[FeFe] hydrogenase H-cluster radical SAM maturase HydE [Spirochaetota bacterium]